MKNNELVLKYDANNPTEFECRDLSYRVFKDLNFTDNHSISFYRSDFRGSQFVSDTFYKNNFDLADFIGNYLSNTEFTKVNFGNCEFKNGVFIKCHFNNNIYGDLAIHNCDFKNCTFENEVFHMTMFDCTFYDCKFINCIFEQCSTERLEFDECTFLKVEMSTMHAENFKFSNCIIRDTFLGACFLGTYLFKNIDLNLLSFKYRGKVISINGDDYFLNYTNELKNQRRYFEFLNLYLLMNGDKTDFCNVYTAVLEDIFKEKNPKVLEYNLNGIFDIFEFYYNSPALSLISCYRIYCELSDKLSNNRIPQNYLLLYSERLQRLDIMLSDFSFSTDYLLSIPKNTISYLQIHCNDDSFKKAEEKIQYILENVNEVYLNSTIPDPLFKIIEEKKGSVILTISSGLLLTLLTTKVIKEIYGTLCDIKITHAKTNKEIVLIESSKSVAKLNEALQINTQNNDSKETSLMKIYNTLGKDYIINMILKIFI